MGTDPSHETSHLLSRPSSTPIRHRFDTEMDELREGLSRFKKDIEHRLGRSIHKPDKPELGDRDESVGPPSPVSQPGPHISTGGSREQGGVPNIENENVRGSDVVDENRPDWKSAASSSAKLDLRAVRDSADVFGLLKSVAGGLCFILENCEV